MSNLALPLPPSTNLPPSPIITTPIKAGPSKTNGVPPSAQRNTNVNGNRGGRRSPSPDADEDEDNDDDDADEAGGRRKKTGVSGPAGGVKRKGGVETKGEYRYTTEISQMMFVFGEVQDPLPETVKLVEDIVRGQIIEIVTRARLLTHLRSSRYLSAEDVIFLIRDDRGKVNRLRTYLSWKDVRKKAKEDDEGDVDVDETDKGTQRTRKAMVKLPWELLTPYSDFLRNLPSRQSRPDEDEEDDDDEIQAYQDSMQRLRDADEITKKMTKDEYVHYSDCRQASFTYRKARRFRDFVNFSAYLDVRPNDDIIDILGFLSFEMVRALCVTALEVRSRLEKASTSPTTKSRSLPGNRPGSTKRKSTISLHSKVNQGVDSPNKKLKGDIVASPEVSTPATATGHNQEVGSKKTQNTAHRPVSLFAPPPSARSPLLPSHVLEAFAQIQREQAANCAGGMKNWHGGVRRNKVALV